MRRLILVGFGLLFFSTGAWAQSHQGADVPLFEQTAAYSYITLNGAPRGANHFSGALLSGVVNQNSWLGWVGELGIYQKDSGPATEKVRTYMIGPRVAIRHPGPFIFFGQVTVGPFLQQSSKMPDPRLVGDSLSISAGVGADLKIGRHVAIRLIQADALRTNAMYTNPRYSSGIVFRFGRRY